MKRSDPSPVLLSVLRSAGAVFAFGVVVLSLSSGGAPFPPAVKAHPWIALLSLGLAAAFALAPGAAGARLRLERMLFASRRRRFDGWLFFTGLASCAYVAWFRLGGVPHLDDSVAALFQARVFAAGHITLPLPEHGEFFTVFGILGPREDHPYLCTMYPPGLSGLLLPGVLLGAPWLVNPVLGALLALAVAALGRELFSERVGRLAGLLTALSPFVTILSGTHLSHTPTGLLLTVCMWAVVVMLNRRSTLYGAIAGGAWALAFLTRPLTALVVGVVIALAPLVRWRRALAAWRGVVLAVLLALAGGGTLLAWQTVTTGDPHTPGHKIGMGRRGKFGFVKLDWARTHTPQIGFRHTVGRMRAIDDKLLGWPLPALLLVLWPMLTRRARLEDWWLFLPWAALLGTYSAYWYWEEYFPARYTFSGTPMLLALAARGWSVTETAFGAASRHAPEPGGEPAPGRLTGWFAAACLFSLAFARPFDQRRISCHHGDVECTLMPAMKHFKVTDGIVFMRSVGRVQTDGDAFNDFYATGFMRNPLDMKGRLIFARDLGPANARLMDAYPGRRYYAYEYIRGTCAANLYEYVRDGEGFRRVSLGMYEKGD